MNKKRPYSWHWESNYVTLLSESTVVAERGLKAIPITDTDIPEKQMHGCIYRLKNAYMKQATREFFRMLGESNSVLFNREHLF